MSKQNQKAFDKVAVINHWNINKDSSGNYFSTIVEARYQGWLLSINRIDSLEQENQILIEELKEARAESSRFGMGA